MAVNIKKLAHNGAEKILKNVVEAINAIIDALDSGTGGGHKILDGSGTEMIQRDNLQFTGATVSDNQAGNKTVVAIPTSLSSFTNDSGFITNTVNNLMNYYLKTETYTQAEVNSLISAVTTLDIEVVQSLPTTDISTTTIYLVPKSSAGTQDVYDEYINTDGTTSGWELIGTTEIDLSNYYTKTEADSRFNPDVNLTVVNGEVCIKYEE